MVRPSFVKSLIKFQIKSDIRHFFVRSGDIRKVHQNYVACWFVNLLYLSLHQNYVINAFLIMTFFMTVGLRSFVVCCITYGNNIWKLRFVFVLDCDIFFISSQYVIYLFDVVTFFDDVRIMLHFGTFELHMTMTWKLCFIFVHHCDIFFRTLQLRYLFVQCS